MNDHLIEAIASHIAIIITLILTKVFEERKQKQRHEQQMEVLRLQDIEISHVKKTINGGIAPKVEKIHQVMAPDA